MDPTVHPFPPGTTPTRLSLSARLSPLATELPLESWRWQIGVLAGYLLLGVIFTWPLVLHLNDSVIQKGDVPVDTAQGVWSLWWVRTALLAGENPYITRMLFYPESINMLYQTLSLPNAILALPVSLLAGPVAAFNSVILLSFALGRYWVYRLAYALSFDRLAALVAGFVFVCTPYQMQRIYGGPLELMASFWLPLYIIMLVRALARRTLTSVLSAALTLFVTTLASQYYGLYAAVYTAFHTTLAAVLAPRGMRLETFLIGAGVGVLWVVLLLPLALWTGTFGADELDDWYARQVFHSVALIDLVAPNVLHPLWGDAAERWLSHYHPIGVEIGASFGAGIAILTGVALRRRWHLAWPWGLLALAMLLLAMGPQLRMTDVESALPGPFLLLDMFPPFRNSSRPAIFVAFMLIPIAIMVANGMTALRSLAAEHARNGGRRWTVALTVLIFLENMVSPWSLMRLTAAPESLALNADPVPGAVLDLPPQLDDGIAMLNQICHGRPIMGGYLARTPFYPLAAFSSATRNLWLAAEPPPDIVALDPAAELASLGARFVVLDLTRLSSAKQQRLREQLAVPGINRFSVSEIREIYAISPLAARPAVILGTGWHQAEHEGERRWRWIGDRAEMLLITREPTAIVLSWQVTAYGSSRPLRLWLGNQQLTELTIPAAPYSRMIVLQLPLLPGRTVLRLESVAERVSDGRRLSLSLSELRIKALPLSEPEKNRASLNIPPTRPATSAAPCR